MIVHVTAEHIAAGERFNCFECPVALAIDAAIGVVSAIAGPRFIAVRPTPAEVGSWALERCAYTPTAVADFMRAFDRGEEVAPFTFELPDLSDWGYRMEPGARLRKP